MCPYTDFKRRARQGAPLNIKIVTCLFTIGSQKLFPHRITDSFSDFTNTGQ